MEKEAKEKQELEENEKEIELEKDDVEGTKEKNEPIKISLKKLVLIICGIIVLVIIRFIKFKCVNRKNNN